jgi:hypothetical protein
MSMQASEHIRAVSDLPAPPVPAEVNLTDYPYMPLDVRRLLRSETWIDAADDPRLGHVLICLWAESWHQVPAASLPDNDKVLARFAMCDSQTWAAIKGRALRGWIKASDGLLYHPVVAEKALEAWHKKREQRERTRAATEARQRQRIERQATERDVDRHEERDVVRDANRNVHQEKGREEKRREEKRREGPSAVVTSPPGEQQWAFKGSVLRVNLRDFSQWEESFDTYPDLGAELAVIDGKFANMEKPPSNPFITASQWLRSEHEKRVRAGKPRRGDLLRENGSSTADPQAAQWRMRVKGYANGSQWLSDWGPDPLSDGCMCPPTVLAEFRDRLGARQ